jgi:hypothetical protein
VSAIQSELAELAHIVSPVLRNLTIAPRSPGVIPYPNPMGVEPFDPS